jgi:hypothetical protein
MISRNYHPESPLWLPFETIRLSRRAYLTYRVITHVDTGSPRSN